MRLKPLRASLLLLACFSQSGCLTPYQRSVVVRTELAKVPATLREACGEVVDVPSRALTAAEVARLWTADRSLSADCAARHGALNDALSQLEAQGQGG